MIGLLKPSADDTETGEAQCWFLMKDRSKSRTWEYVSGIVLIKAWPRASVLGMNASVWRRFTSSMEVTYVDLLIQPASAIVKLRQHIE